MIASVGKPSSQMIASVLKRVQRPAGECVMTGERLETDVAMALAAGTATALTLTGATSEAMAARSDTMPTCALRSLEERLPDEFRAHRRAVMGVS